MSEPTTSTSPESSSSPSAHAQTSFFGRLGSWFKRGSGNSGGGIRNGDLPLMHDISDRAGDASHAGTGEHGPVVRGTFLRPWAKRDQAIVNLQEGFQTLNELMGAVRDNLERQGQRQDQLLQHLAHLPEALATTAQSSKLQNETLRAIHQQIANQGEQTRQLTDILDKISDTGGNQQEILDSLRDRVETINQQDKVISDTLSNVGAAMQSVSSTTQTSAEVLRQIKQDASTRDDQLEKILHKQNTRFTTMLAIAIFLSVGALVAVSLIGYMMLQARGG